MQRIVVFGQGGAFGRATCGHVADRLGRRLALPLLPAGDAERRATNGQAGGWIVVQAVGAFSAALFCAADTAIWLHFSTLAVARRWARDTKRRLSAAPLGDDSPSLIDLAASVQHMACTPYVRHWLQQRSLAHLHVHHLRNPAEVDFWLYAQDQRVPSAAIAQPA